MNLIDTPAVLVDLDRVEVNLIRMARLAAEGGTRLVPHAKSHKIPELARRQVAAGAAGITCQKLGEAEVMIRAGIGDVLIAFPIVGRIKVERLLALAEVASVTTVVDDFAAAAAVGQAAADRGLTIETLIEVDLGYRRCGVPAPEPAGLALALTRVPGLRLTGLMGYEGHIYDSPDQATAEQRARAAYDLLATAAEEVRAAGVRVDRVSVGGTASARVAVRHPAVTELRAGSYLLNDRTQVAMGAAPKDCALTVVTTVVSTAAGGHVVVDAGSKALSFTRLAQGEGYAVVADRPELVLDRLSDEHGMITVPPGGRVPFVGDRLQLLPNAHAAVIDNFDEVITVRDGRAEGTLTVEARGCMR